MILSPAQEGYVNAYVEEIIRNLPPRAMQELLSGYEDDLDRLLLEMKNQVCMVTHMDRTLDIEKLEYLSSMERSMDQSLRKLSYNYFKTTMLPGFRQGWRNLEWGNIFQLYPYSSVLASRGSGKCFSPGTEVLMFDGSCKRVEDIEVGDEVMGRDFLPRKVTELHHGVDTMYRVTQDGGMTYTVNKGHLIYCALLGTAFRSVPVESVGILKHMEYDVYGVRVEEDKIFPMFQSIRVTEVGQGEYYGFACNGDHLFLLKDGTIVHNSFEGCFAFTLWRLYSYDRPSTFLRESVDNANRKETCIITNNETLGKKHIVKMVEEITHNDLLTEKLNPTNSASLAATSITTETGSILHLRSKDSMIRGLHVGAVVCDDLPDESSLYSQEQREKLREVFYGSITPIVEPYGYLLVMGCVTPDTYVYTEGGIREIGDLAPVPLTSEKGFYPLDIKVHDGEDFVSTSDYYINGDTPTKIITLQNGLRVETSYIHPLLVCNDMTGCFEWRKAEDLGVGDSVAFRSGTGCWGKPLNVEGKELYEIGLCIADGTIDVNNGRNRVTIAKGVPGIRDFLINERCYKPVKNRLTMNINSKSKLSLWLSLGYRPKMYSHTKTVPSKIMGASEEDVIWFLRGCFDGDGCCYYIKKRNKQRVAVSYFSTSYRLIQQIQTLLLNMGIDSWIEEKQCQSTELVKSDRIGYNLVINRFDSVKLFMGKIGFLYSGKAKPLSSATTSTATDKGIPYQMVLLQKVRSRYKMGSERMKQYGMRPADFYSKIHSFERLQGPIRSWLETLPCDDEDVKSLLSNMDRGFRFSTVKSIEEGRSITVDFKIPVTHKFLSNGIVSHNTPYSPADIYGNLKEDKRFKVFEYPAVFPNGQLLAPDRLTFKRLTEERQSLGTIVFNREYLVVPIADTATIFPYEYLKRSIMGMEHISFANDIESFPIKLTRVVTGCDFALSGNIGADYSVYTVWGVDSAGLIYLVAMLRMQGASHDLQVNKILEFNARYKPNKIICEANGFQRILAGMAKERGLVNIEEFVTTEGNKKDLRTGLPSLSALFESARLRVPYGNEETRKLVDIMFGEFNSIAFNPQKGTLESASGHDDICMSSFMAIQELREHRSVAMLDYID